MDLMLDPVTGDLVIEGGDLQIASGLDAIAQHVWYRLQFFKGEWFLDTRIGIPYYTDILIKNPNFNTIRSLLRSAVATTPGVLSLTSFDLVYDGASRTLTVSFEAETTEGTLVFDQELIL